MMTPRVVLWQLGKELPVLEAPFAVVLDADDLSWTNGDFQVRWIRELLLAGCRYFVCFGKGSERLHDDIDEIIVADEYESVITTFHEDESPEEVADFFRNAASSDMTSSLILVGNTPRWEELF